MIKGWCKPLTGKKSESLQKPESLNPTTLHLATLQRQIIKSCSSVYADCIDLVLFVEFVMSASTTVEKRQIVFGLWWSQI